MAEPFVIGSLAFAWVLIAFLLGAILQRDVIDG